MGRVINETKTKYMLIACHTDVKNDFIVGPYTIKQVENFKYFGVDINHKNNMHSKVNLKINSMNRALFSLNNF